MESFAKLKLAKRKATPFEQALKLDVRSSQYQNYLTESFDAPFSQFSLEWQKNMII